VSAPLQGHLPGPFPGPLDDCLWPLDRRDELTAALASAAGIGRLGPSERFELGYADVAPALTPRARAEAPAVLRVGSGTGALLGIVSHAANEVRLLAPGGAFVAKIFQGPDVEVIRKRMAARFSDVRTVKPDGSRAESTEIYLAGKGFA